MKVELTEGDECPIARDTHTTSRPSAIHNDATSRPSAIHNDADVCRMSWNTGSGSAIPAASRTRAHMRPTLRWSSGPPASDGNTGCSGSDQRDASFCSRSARTANAGSGTSRTPFSVFVATSVRVPRCNCERTLSRAGKVLREELDPATLALVAGSTEVSRSRDADGEKDVALERLIAVVVCERNTEPPEQAILQAPQFVVHRAHASDSS